MTEENIRMIYDMSGGEKKSFNQIIDVPDSYLAVDGIEVGRGCRIPLWLFGFLY